MIPDSAAGAGSRQSPATCFPLDISDLVAQAIEERRKYIIASIRRSEIEAEIAKLQEELKALPKEDNWYVPQWRVDLDRRLEEAISSAANR